MNRLFAVGLLVIMAGLAMVSLGSASRTGSSTGGFILIGPIPIVFGSGADGGQLATLALAAGVLMLAVAAVWLWRLGSLRG